MVSKLWIVILCFALAGCLSTSNVLEVGRDTYSVTATADGFRLASQARESAFSAGAEKCSSMGKHFLLINESSGRTRMGIDTTITVIFRCLNVNDPEFIRPSFNRSVD